MIPTRARRVFRFGAVAALALLVGGCAALMPPQTENPSLYVLTADAPHATKPGAAPRDVVVEVALPRAWAGYDTPRMAYVRQPYALEYFAASRWADTLPRMLGPLVARALEETGSFRAVVQTPSSVSADYRVDTEIVRVQQSFASQPSRVEIALRVQLIDVRGRRVVAGRLFEDAEAARTDDAAGGVTAANAALGRLLRHIAEFCVAESTAPSRSRD